MSTFAGALRDAYRFGPSFEGRATRSQFWWFYLYFAGFGAALNLLWYVPGPVGLVGGVLGLIFVVGNLPSLVGLLVRRLHDTNRSGTWALVCVVPVAGLLTVLYFLVRSTSLETRRGSSDPS
jgi:uncharacterized membrane protein YhaH (DUF805 family)